MTSAVLRILLADDHAVLRAGLRMLLQAEPDMQVVGEAGHAQEVLEAAAQLQPDVILLDVAMPGSSGLAILPRLRSVAPRSRILILTMYEDEAYLRQALQMGALGYVLKKAADVELLSAIRAVARDEIYVQPSMARLLLEGLLPRYAIPADSDASRWQSLSEREQQVMRGVAYGYTSEEIARQYHLSVKTVYTYRARAMTKLGIENRAQLVDLALRLGILGDSDTRLKNP
jgi:two-component system response regulator NreC